MTKLNLNRPIQTRDGRAARLLAVLEGATFPLVVAVARPEGFEECHARLPSGRLYQGYESPADIVNVSQKVSMYVNVWRGKSGYVYFGSKHASRDTADYAASVHDSGSQRIGCVRIEAEERTLDGKFDE